MGIHLLTAFAVQRASVAELLSVLGIAVQEKHDAGRMWMYIVCLSIRSVRATSLLAVSGDMELQQPCLD